MERRGKRSRILVRRKWEAVFPHFLDCLRPHRRKCLPWPPSSLPSIVKIGASALFLEGGPARTLKFPVSRFPPSPGLAMVLVGGDRPVARKFCA